MKTTKTMALLAPALPKKTTTHLAPPLLKMTAKMGVVKRHPPPLTMTKTAALVAVPIEKKNAVAVGTVTELPPPRTKMTTTRRTAVAAGAIDGRCHE